MEERTIVVFDSDCLMCQGSLKWLNRLDADDQLLFAPMGGETAKKWGISMVENDSLAVVKDGEVYRSSEAARLTFLGAGGLGRVIALGLQVIPLGVREWGYYLIARNREKLVRKPSCGIPEEGMREKLLD